METELVKIKEKVKDLLAGFLGVDIDDINDEDDLSRDLHMTPSDITDFLQLLETNNIDTTDLNLVETETFEELIENLIQHQ